MPKKATALILTHNREEYLPKIFQNASAFISEFNFILLNNGEELTLDVPEWIEYHWIPDLELTPSYQFLIHQSKTKYSFFWEDDDMFFLNNVSKILNIYSADIFLGNKIIWNKNSGMVEFEKLWEDMDWKPSAFIRSYFTLDPNCYIQLSQFIFLTDHAKKIIFPPSNIICLDEFFFWELVSKARLIRTIADFFYQLNIHTDHLSWNNPENILLNGEKHIDFLESSLYNKFNKKLIDNFLIQYRNTYRRRIEKTSNNSRTHRLHRSAINRDSSST